jgi:diacylglycerol kinase family enzyme
MELKSAIENLGSGRAIAVDVGEVNGQIFVNNSGLGLYPAIVRLREKRQARGASKWIAAAIAALAALRHYHRLALQVSANGKELLRRTSIVFLGNNEYTMEGLNIGTRTQLDAGRLCLYITRETSSLKLLGLTLSALMGKLQKNRDYDKILTDEVWIRSKHSTLNVSIDGEVIRLASPLHYRIRPKALWVLVPGEER